MNRRSFLRWFGIAPVAVAGASVLPVEATEHVINKPGQIDWGNVVSCHMVAPGMTRIVTQRPDGGRTTITLT